MAREMNGRPVTISVPAVRHSKQRRKRGIVPKGGRAALSPKERELHAQLRADGCLKSGRCGGYDYYVVRGKQRDSEMLLRPRQREQKPAKNQGLRPELTTQVSQSQPITRSTSWTHRAHAVPAPSVRRVARGYARNFKARKLMLQVPRLQRLPRSTSDRPRTAPGPLPVRCQWEAGSARVIGKTGSRERFPTLGKVTRNAHSPEIQRGG